MRISKRRSIFVTALAAVAAATAFATVSFADITIGSRAGADPVRFLEGVVRQIATNDYARAWETLAPAQQRLVPKAEYVRCESASPIPGRLAWLRVVRSFGESVTVAGGSAAPVDARAVTFRLKIADAHLGVSVVLTHTVHAVQDSGRWAWILPPERLRLHRSGACGLRPAHVPA